MKHVPENQAMIYIAAQLQDAIVCFVPLPHLLSKDMQQLITATGGQTSTGHLLTM